MCRPTSARDASITFSGTPRRRIRSATSGPTARHAATQAGPPVDTGTWVLHVHIPESGPLDPPAVAESFARAAEFFPTCFPDHPVSVAVCSSWLLDPYLAEHLPGSNIARFARLFTPYGEPMDDENDALYFVFGRRSTERLDELPRRSSLQRLILDRIAAGGRWQRVRGYRLLADPARPDAG